MTAKLHTTTFLDRDLELVVQANELGHSWCFAEKDPRHPGTTALQLMLIPHFELPPIPQQEYLFLMDRNGSMRSGRLDMAKQCVRFLPNKHAVFNSFDFNDSHWQLWQRSRSYGDQTLREAVGFGLDRWFADVCANARFS
jgi:hypothetical protein